MTSLEEGFVKGQSDNLPQVDNITMFSFLRKHPDFMGAEMKGVKAKSFALLHRKMWNSPNCLMPHAAVGINIVDQVRTNIRKHFYRPSERLRLKKHSYQTRLKTPGGRAIIMRRILKGRFILSH